MVSISTLVVTVFAIIGAMALGEVMGDTIFYFLKWLDYKRTSIKD